MIQAWKEILLRTPGWEQKQTNKQTKTKTNKQTKKENAFILFCNVLDTWCGDPKKQFLILN